MSPGDDSARINALLAGIAQHANALGDPAAPVTLEYFGDLQCPFCRDFSLGVLPSLIERWVRESKLRIEYRALQTATGEPAVFLAQQTAALAAGRQALAWHFIESFYAEQGTEGSGYVTDAFLHAIAGEIPGIDLERWARDRGDPRLVEEIAGDERAAESAGLSGTPSFLIRARDGTVARFSGTDSTSFDRAIEAALEQ